MLNSQRCSPQMQRQWRKRAESADRPCKGGARDKCSGTLWCGQENSDQHLQHHPHLSHHHYSVPNGPADEKLTKTDLLWQFTNCTMEHENFMLIISIGTIAKNLLNFEIFIKQCYLKAWSCNSSFFFQNWWRDWTICFNPWLDSRNGTIFGA